MITIDQYQRQISQLKKRHILDKYLIDKYVVNKRGIYHLDGITQEQLRLLRDEIEEDDRILFNNIKQNAVYKKNRQDLQE